MQLGSLVLVSVLAWSLGAWWAQSPDASERSLRTVTGRVGSGWAAFDVATLRGRRRATGSAYLEFLGASTLRTGLYVLPRGAVDGQSPHEQDEVYSVVRGRAGLEMAGERLDVEPGSVVFVAAGVPHRFVDIEEDLEVLVFFSTADPVDEDEDADER